MLSDTVIKEILVQQREILLNKNFGVERTLLKKIESKIKLPHIIVLTGLRRSGKSTLLRQVIKTYYADKEFYYINFEDERLFDFPAKEFNRIYDALISLYGKQKTFFIDEIQNISGFETFVRRLYDEGFKFFITGSNATLLSKELGTKLTGRHMDVIVRPFSFAEFLKLKGVTVATNDIYKIEKKVEIKKHFLNYITYGGMPEYIIYNDPEILARIYDDTIIKDVSVRYKVHNIYALKQLYSYLISNFSNKFSYNSIKKIIDIKSINTIKKFISYAEETYLIKTITKFDYSIRKQIINDKKVYIVDNGFICTISKKMTKDYGWLLENMIFNSLITNHEVFYYSGKKECDFITVKNNLIHQAIQVCYELNADNKEREISGLIEAMDKFKIKEGIILTLGQEEELKAGRKKIKILPAWKWMLDTCMF